MDFESEEALLEFAASSTGRSFASLSLTHGDTLLGTVVFELYSDIVPRTCHHFLSYVEGQGHLSYKGSPIHRVVKNAFIQGGDVVDGTGKGNPGFQLADESFAVKHDSVGIIAMATNGEPNTAGTQFYVTLGPLPWLDGKRVAFGKVLNAEGLSVLKKVEEVMLNQERPVPELVITDARVIHRAVEES